MASEEIVQEFEKLIKSGKSVNASQKILKQKYGHGLRNTVAYHMKAEILKKPLSEKKQKIGRKAGLKSGYVRKANSQINKNIKIIIDEAKGKPINFNVSERGKLWYIYFTAICTEKGNHHEESFSFGVYHHTLQKMTKQDIKNEMIAVISKEGWSCKSGKTVFRIERYTS